MLLTEDNLYENVEAIEIFKYLVKSKPSSQNECW